MVVSRPIRGNLVYYCTQNGKLLEELCLEELQGISPLFEEDVYEALRTMPAASTAASSGRHKKTRSASFISFFRSAVSEYEAEERQKELVSPRHYAVTLSHKHIPEMVKVCGLERKPVFMPMICDFPQGMVVTIPLYLDMLNGQQTLETLRAADGFPLHRPQLRKAVDPALRCPVGCGSVDHLCVRVFHHARRFHGSIARRIRSPAPGNLHGPAPELWRPRTGGNLPADTRTDRFCKA